MAINEMQYQAVLHHLTGAYEVAREHDLKMHRNPTAEGDYDTSLSELLIELIDRLDYRLAQKLRSRRTLFAPQETQGQRNREPFARARRDAAHATAPVTAPASLRVEPEFASPSHDVPDTT